MTYARQRLWLGITGVGSTVVLSAAALLFDLPHRFMRSPVDQSFAGTLAAIALVFVGHALVILPLDVVGGVVVVRERPSLIRWAASWLRAVFVQWLWFALAVAMLLRTAQEFGTIAALLVFVLMQLVLLSQQGLLAQLVGGVRMLPVSEKLTAAASAAGIPAGMVREIAADDHSFVGGWTGVSVHQLWVAERWVSALSAGQLAVALARRVGVRALGLRQRGVLVALAWNTIGFALAASAPRASLANAAGFVTVMAWFTLWQFVGVLVLPSLSRPAVLAADRWAWRTHADTLVASTITQLDRWQDDEAERGRRVETVFHPVPSRGARLRALTAGDQPSGNGFMAAGAWHATRMMLYLGWAGLGGLSRVVHCNLGRPTVWVMLPGD